MAKQDDFVRYTIRVPADLYERVQKAAGEKSVNAEIVATLREKYPPQTIDMQVLSEFLASLHGISAPDGNKEYLEVLNGVMRQLDQPWTIEAGWDGAVTFYPMRPRNDKPKP